MWFVFGIKALHSGFFGLDYTPNEQFLNIPFCLGLKPQQRRLVFLLFTGLDKLILHKYNITTHGIDVSHTND